MRSASERLAGNKASSHWISNFMCLHNLVRKPGNSQERFFDVKDVSAGRWLMERDFSASQLNNYATKMKWEFYFDPYQATLHGISTGLHPSIGWRIGSKSFLRFLKMVQRFPLQSSEVQNIWKASPYTLMQWRAMPFFIRRNAMCGTRRWTGQGYYQALARWANFKVGR